MPINKNEITKEMLAKAMQCRTAEELMALAKSEGLEVTKEEAEAYLAEIDDFELEEEALEKVAGGYNICENYGKACPGYINVG
jgi:predicted ribosomally synthesized peptide with nif11-like leader